MRLSRVGQIEREVQIGRSGFIEVSPPPVIRYPTIRYPPWAPPSFFSYSRTIGGGRAIGSWFNEKKDGGA